MDKQTADKIMGWVRDMLYPLTCPLPTNEFEEKLYSLVSDEEWEKRQDESIDAWCEED